MITMRRQFLGLGFIAASSILAIHSAQALSGPTAITIDGGPLGSLSLSGGVDGYGYYLSGTPSYLQSDGMNVANALVELQKTDGQIQFTIEIGSNQSSVTLGAPAFSAQNRLAETSVNTFTTGPLYLGYVTLAPTNSPLTISAGQFGSLEGYESGIDWNDSVQLTTAIFDVQNSNSRGIEAALTEGTITATVLYGDETDTGAFDGVQALVTDAFNANNSLNVYGTLTFARTGPNTIGYGGGQTGYGNAFSNSNMIGAYYSYTTGNLNLVPEAQFQYTHVDHAEQLDKYGSNFGTALFADYTVPNSPYSLGAWAEYYSSNGPYDYLITPHAQMVGFAVAPTWQYKDLFARANAGYSYLIHGENPSYDGGKGQFLGTVEAGLLF
jgi:hypothetical protein